MKDKLLSDVSSIRRLLADYQQSLKGSSSGVARSDDALAIVEKRLAAKGIPPNSPDYQRLTSCAFEYSGVVKAAISAHGTFILTGTAHACFRFFPGELGVLMKDIETVDRRYNVREEVCASLREHNAEMADMFQSGWQTLEATATDPVRGPAFLMWETVTHFFHHFAPDEAIVSRGWWKSHDEKTKFTFGHRTALRRSAQLSHFLVKHPQRCSHGRKKAKADSILALASSPYFGRVLSSHRRNASRWRRESRRPTDAANCLS
jgi:hypothetical protein